MPQAPELEGAPARRNVITKGQGATNGKEKATNPASTAEINGLILFDQHVRIKLVLSVLSLSFHVNIVTQATNRFADRRAGSRLCGGLQHLHKLLLLYATGTACCLWCHADARTSYGHAHRDLQYIATLNWHQ